jgi:alkanesulfonate monooxygenase SsuD/methylene tetrahydromethanopterin reductase-like flavin-dependent oxidoreductase (luciferase family)
MAQHRTRPLQVGLMLPAIEGDLGGATPRWHDIVALAQQAEAIGLDALWVPDHFLFREPGADPQGEWECWTLLAALAAVTSRVSLGPLVACTSFRNPALLAKIADTVDEISGGRLILGLGAGWNEPEYDAFGYPFDHLASRFAEALTIIHGLLRHGQVDFTGTYASARECELRPRGPRPTGPPIMVAGSGPRMLRLTAQYADAWHIWLSNQPAGLAPLQEAVDAACMAVGRNPTTLERSVGVVADLTGGGVWPVLHEPGAPLLSGSPETMADALRSYAHAGLTRVDVWLAPNTLAGLEAFAPVLELLDRG